MKKYLSMLAMVLAAFFMVACNNKPKAPEKTPAQLKADSIAKVKKDSVTRVENFKKFSTDNFVKVVKNQISSDPDYGRILETSWLISSDSICLAKCKFAFKNKYGAVEQYDGLYLLVCRNRPNNECMLMLGRDAMDRYLNNASKDCCYLPLILSDDDEMRSKVIYQLCEKGQLFFNVERFVEKGFDFSPF